jgi:cytochrome d ubiquinol oxidase subunit I
VVVLGDESGYVAGENQKMKLAAIEAMWETEPAPAGFNAFAIPHQDTHSNSAEVHIPWVMGLIGTRSFNTEMPGILPLVDRARERIRSGQQAYAALQDLRADRSNAAARETFDARWNDLGYGLLLKRYRDDIGNASNEQIEQAAFDTVPRVAPLFWFFRAMAGIGFYFIGFFALAFWFASRHTLHEKRWFLKVAFWSLALPWVAIEAGWIVAEYGRQPWIIDGVLPTFFAASGLKLHQILISLAMFVSLYTTLAVVDVYLLRKTILKGPTDVAGGRQPDTAGAPLAAANA